MNRSNKAFTLIELLVVIAIIAILAAILFPVFAQAKLAAKKTVALSSAKQIALANEMYMGDNNDALVKEYFGFPQAPACNWGSLAWGTPGLFYTWRYALQPYQKSENLIRDPSNAFSEKRFDTISWDGQGAAPDKRLSANFAVNNTIIGFANGSCAGPYTPEGQQSMSNVDEPSSTIIILANRSQWNDLKWFFGTVGVFAAQGGPASVNDSSWCITPAGATTPTCPRLGNGPIHAVGRVTNWVYGDGHAKAKAYAQTLRAESADTDDWATRLAINPVTGQPYTQADRILAANNLFPEYK